jgi:hypothetical protein
MKYALNIVPLWKTGPTLWLLSKVNIISFVDLCNQTGHHTQYRQLLTSNNIVLVGQGNDFLKGTQHLSGNREEVPQAVKEFFNYIEGKLVQLLREYCQIIHRLKSFVVIHS